MRARMAFGAICWGILLGLAIAALWFAVEAIAGVLS